MKPYIDKMQKELIPKYQNHKRGFGIENLFLQNKKKILITKIIKIIILGDQISWEIILLII